MLSLFIGPSRRSVGGIFLTNNKEIKEVLERELNVSSIRHYGRGCIYEHLQGQRYLIARSVSIYNSSIRL